MSGSLHAFTPYDIELKVLFILFLCFFSVVATYCVLNMQQFSSLPLCISFFFFAYVGEKSRFLVLKLVFSLHANLNYHGIIGSSLNSIKLFRKVEQILRLKRQTFCSAAAGAAV